MKEAWKSSHFWDSRNGSTPGNGDGMALSREVCRGAGQRPLAVYPRQQAASSPRPAAAIATRKGTMPRKPRLALGWGCERTVYGENEHLHFQHIPFSKDPRFPQPAACARRLSRVLCPTLAPAQHDPPPAAQLRKELAETTHGPGWKGTGQWARRQISPRMLVTRPWAAT